MMTSAVVLVITFCLWATLHSLLASLRVKGWAQRVLGRGVKRWYRLVFNAIAGLTFLPWMVLIVLLPDRPLYVIPFPWRWLTMTGQALALIALLWTLVQTGPMHFLGVTQLLAAGPKEHSALQIRGLYCYVRHPLYFFSLVLLWLVSQMTINTATANVLIALYFWIGSILEERKLLAEFGAAYAEYQRHVPRMIPRLRRCYPPTENENRGAVT